MSRLMGGFITAAPLCSRRLLFDNLGLAAAGDEQLRSAFHG